MGAITDATIHLLLEASARAMAATASVDGKAPIRRTKPIKGQA